MNKLYFFGLFVTIQFGNFAEPLIAQIDANIGVNAEKKMELLLYQADETQISKNGTAFDGISESSDDLLATNVNDPFIDGGRRETNRKLWHAVQSLRFGGDPFSDSDGESSKMRLSKVQLLAYSTFVFTKASEGHTNYSQCLLLAEWLGEDEEEITYVLVHFCQDDLNRVWKLADDRAIFRALLSKKYKPAIDDVVSFVKNTTFAGRNIFITDTNGVVCVVTSYMPELREFNETVEFACSPEMRNRLKSMYLRAICRW